MKEEIILYKIEDLIFSYTLGREKMEVISRLNLEIPGEALSTISGPSGSGKSTLLNILGLIEPLQRGRILFKNEDITALTEIRKNYIRKFQIGFIFQQFHLNPTLTAEENINYFLFRQNLPKKEIRERCEEALEAVHLWEHRKKRPSELSGGQKQRVAIARAMAKRPAVIIGDEPTANLDQKTGYGIMEVLAKWVESRKSSIILTTHDSMVQSFGKQNFHLQDGRLRR
ncbi:MAG: ABC transporter ATP-binding protein [Verrucomicrobia bacterium]|nr:ABC transporter ATP-binding protein [Verrucomicrobiota bacterium]